MTYKIEDGGPAFPSEHSSNSPAPNGMSLRDYFAAKAMQSMFEKVVQHEDFKSCAKRAYWVADAMLEARK